MFGRQASRNFAAKIDRSRAETMEVAPQLPFDQSGPAGNAAAAEIALGREMDFAVRPNRAAEARGDFIIAQVDVLAALRANRRGRGGADLLRGLTIEALDDGAMMLAPESFQFPKKRRIRDGFDHLLFRP